ncbi:putative GTPase activating protein for Arf [Lyophyllum shimeji]|uniref:GTPase activating protein for Arf n=1 Tax=Lyophyllum shimeji TaxID=47721 RepID=A0A9P3PIB8_LYOSH|nr:putative GTPase activating protein for Arf [Lyophyllum shimeji]
MSKQDKATTEKFTRTLRELVKQPDNKVCADCKRNDPRWASWNIGVFLCIRCSGIHRGMGTHISKVKSVDLDTWTPEQMQSIQKWGNYLANLYWEAHLKPGHIPPEHKMESFIRSKYESRRWALDGPPPTDPSVLANGARAQAEASPVPAPQPQPTPTASSSRPTHSPSASLSGASATTRQPQARQLLSTNYTNTQRQATAAAAAPSLVAAKAPSPPPAQRKAPENDLFSLDFHAPPTTATPAASEAQKKDVKQDILSLFSSPPPASAPSAFGPFGAQSSAASPWGAQPMPNQQQMWQPQQQPQQQPAVTSMLGTSGVGAWGVSSGWGAPSAAAPAQSNLWGATPAASVNQQQALFNTTAVWGSAPAAAPAPAQDLFGSFGGAGTGTGTGAGLAAQSKKDDVFGDLWGGFK